jgi:heme-degrading monooxygenase HmoA
MICRIWHGWTTEANADAYESLLRSEIFVGILRREIPGFQAIDLLRRSVPEGIEFVTLMWFDSIEAVQRRVQTTRLLSYHRKHGGS